MPAASNAEAPDAILLTLVACLKIDRRIFKDSTTYTQSKEITPPILEEIIVIRRKTCSAPVTTIKRRTLILVKNAKRPCPNASRSEGKPQEIGASHPESGIKRSQLKEQQENQKAKEQEDILDLDDLEEAFLNFPFLNFPSLHSLNLPGKSTEERRHPR